MVFGEVEGLLARGFEHVEQVAFTVFEDHIDGGGDVGDGLRVVCFFLGGGLGGGLGRGGGGGGDFLEADHVLVGHAAEELDFTEGGDGELD